jgi:hypothetical protein
MDGRCFEAAFSRLVQAGSRLSVSGEETRRAGKARCCCSLLLGLRREQERVAFEAAGLGGAGGLGFGNVLGIDGDDA